MFLFLMNNNELINSIVCLDVRAEALTSFIY